MTGPIPLLRAARTLAAVAAAGFAGSLALAVPAYAQSAVLPDPSGFTLFALGVAGLIVGRRVVSRRRDSDE